MTRDERPVRQFLASLRDSRGLRQLFGVRIVSQLSDGAFQAALGGAILFNPQRAADAVAVAAGMAVLLLPYSILGPFAGALLDHWDRRAVLLWANAFRAVCIVGVAALVAVGASQFALLIAALLAQGGSRFVAAGLSAALPHVVTRKYIVAINSILVTVGTGLLAAGAAVALCGRAVFGEGNAGSGATLLISAALAVLAALSARSFAPGLLGPDTPDVSGRVDAAHPSGSAVRAVAVGWAHGAKAVAAARAVAAALGAVTVHRFVFGVDTLVLLVMSRSDRYGGGLTTLSLVVGLVAGGTLFAAVLAPFTIARYGRRVTLLGALAAGVVAQLGIGLQSVMAAAIVAPLLGLVGQTTKLTGDAAMQLDISDRYRGQAFSFQDALFNMAYVAAIALAAMFIPADGHTPLLLLSGAVAYAIAFAGVFRLHPRESRTETSA